MTIKELFAPSDMTVGKPWEKIVIFTIPMLIGNIAQQLYNTVDSIVIGKYVGDNALAAVGSASPILNLLLVLFVGISVGAGVMVSQYFGARQREELSMTIGNCVTLTAISSLIIMFLGAVLSRPLLEMLHTPDSIIDWCTSYLVILMVGCMGLILTLVAFGLPMSVFMFTNFISSIPRALDEASIIDGANIIQTFFYIILPQLKPIIATVVILHGVAAWNEYAYSMYIMQKPELLTITLTIKKYFSSVGNNYGGAAASAVLAILPLTIIYLLLQDAFVQGQVDSAIT